MSWPLEMDLTVNIDVSGGFVAQIHRVKQAYNHLRLGRSLLQPLALRVRRRPYGDRGRQRLRRLTRTFFPPFVGPRSRRNAP